MLCLPLINMCPDLENPLIISSANDGSAAKMKIDHNPVKVECRNDVRVFRHFHLVINSLSPGFLLKKC